MFEYGWVDWKGVRVLKTAAALMAQQEIIHETQPELIIETGTKFGGSACFYADLMVEVVSVDCSPPKPPKPHFLVTYLIGYSTSERILFEVGRRAAGRRTMVVLDSDHSAENVAAELEAYAPFVSSGCYLIVEDVDQGGPQEALDAWPHPGFQQVDIPHVPEHAFLLRS